MRTLMLTLCLGAVVGLGLAGEAPARERLDPAGEKSLVAHHHGGGWGRRGGGRGWGHGGGGWGYDRGGCPY